MRFCGSVYGVFGSPVKIARRCVYVAQDYFFVALSQMKSSCFRVLNLVSCQSEKLGNEDLQAKQTILENE